MFNLTVGTSQPLTIDIWNYTSVISNTPLQINSYTLSQIGSNRTYRISSNTNTITYNLTQLTNCTFPCKLCSSSQCLQCYSSALTNMYFLDSITNSCVAIGGCSNNTFADTATNTCRGCPATCSSCSTSTNCTACLTNYYLLNGSCLTDCPSGYYPIDISQTCALCNNVNNTAFCSSCITLNQCSSCLTSYLLQPSSRTCVVSCTTNQVAVNGTCFDCLIPCSTCLTNTSNCISCLSGYYLHNNQCISACPAPLVPDSNNICV